VGHGPGHPIRESGTGVSSAKTITSPYRRTRSRRRPCMSRSVPWCRGTKDERTNLNIGFDYLGHLYAVDGNGKGQQSA
jgi:hypothetical protein